MKHHLLGIEIMVFFQTHVNSDDLESGDTPPKPELAGNHHVE